MEELFIKEIKVQYIRHITNLDIPLDEEVRKHLIITGKNGSGKTSLLEELKQRLRVLVRSDIGTQILFNDYEQTRAKWEKGNFITVFFGAKRNSQLIIPNGINKVHLKDKYEITEYAAQLFVQYIVNLKADRLFAKEDNDLETVEKIDKWFENFEDNLLQLFDIKGVKLHFDYKSYDFKLVEEGKAPYNFNQLSDGYAAIFAIVAELIMRMENHKVKNYDVQGVVLIDEVETHLHIDLQKKIMPFLTSFFPKIQFIVTTHSPFVISSIANAVVCDLEKRIVTSDLSGYSYDTLIESYFDSDKYSDILKTKIADYERLVDAQTLTEGEKDRLWELKQYLEQIPKFAADELAVKLQQIKLKELNKKRNNGILPKVQ